MQFCSSSARRSSAISPRLRCVHHLFVGMDPTRAVLFALVFSVPRAPANRCDPSSCNRNC